MELRPLSNDVLLSRLEILVLQERGTTADVVEHLAEVDRRELVVDRGYSTLFDYCVRQLHFSEAAAFLRIRAARAARDYPRVLADLRSGNLHLDTIMRIYPHLDERNSDALLDRVAGAPKREVLKLVAQISGAEVPKRDVIRYLPTEPIPSADENPTVLPPPKVRLAFTADDQFVSMVDRLRRLRRHKHPDGRLEDLLKEALVAFLKQIDPQERSTALRAKAGPSGSPRASRRIPAAVKALVWSRDGGRCAFISDGGRRCGSNEFLEYDHIKPWALGGASDDPTNIRLLCRPHNQRIAKRRFGPRHRNRSCPTASGRTAVPP